MNSESDMKSKKLKWFIKKGVPFSIFRWNHSNEAYIVSIDNVRTQNFTIKVAPIKDNKIGFLSNHFHANCPFN